MNTKRICMVAMLPVMVWILSCQRRPLENEYYDTALVPVRIDWSASGVEVAKMHRASVLLFPDGGGRPLEYRLEGDLTYREIAVPMGVYSVVVFNETTDASDWEGLTFTNLDSYQNFAAAGVNDARRGFYVRAVGLPLIKNPEPLAAWGLDRFEVTREMVLRSREASRSRGTNRSLDSEIPELTVVKPLPRYEKIVITARVTNLASSMQSTGTIDGMASGVYMASGRKMAYDAAHSFILNGRVYDANKKDGTTTRTFNIFGRLPLTAARQELNIDFLLVDGTLQPRETFNATALINPAPGATVPTIGLDVGYGTHADDRTIALPDMDVASTVSVEDWDEVIIPVQ